jgi:hypothetical protein
MAIEDLPLEDLSQTPGCIHTKTRGRITVSWSAQARMKLSAEEERRCLENFCRKQQSIPKPFIRSKASGRISGNGCFDITQDFIK